MTFQLSDGSAWRSPADFGLVVQPGHTNDLSAPISRRSVRIPGRAGTISFGVDVASRLFRFPVVFPFELTRVELQQRIDQLMDYLLDSRSQPRELMLRFDYEPDRHYMVRLTGNTDIERDLSLGFTELTFYAADPYAYSNDESVFAELIGSGTFTLTNSGKSIKPIIKLTNVAVMGWDVNLTGGYDLVDDTSSVLVNPAITINGDVLLYVGTLQVGESIEIDTARFTVTLNGVNVLKHIEGVFPVLKTGDNTITTNAFMRVEITYRERW